MKHLQIQISLGFLVAMFAFTSGCSKGYAQSENDHTKRNAAGGYQTPTNMPIPMLNTTYATPGMFKNAGFQGDETEIMETVFDLQTNKTLSNRFWVWDDGTMAAVATRGMEAPGFPDRGTGYNYYDGSAWGPMPDERIESVRTGWPSIAPLGQQGEIVVSHMAANNEWSIVINKRETKGSGAWQESTLTAPQGAAGLLWPRMTTSGNDNQFVHVFVLTTPTSNGGVVYEDQDGALLYYRSSDYGETWDIQAELLEGLGADFYTRIGADEYGVAARGNTVAVFHASAWADLFFLKSEDNGETWNKTVIWEHPYPFFDFNTTLFDDSLYTVDNSANIAIDKNGMVHIVWGVTRVFRGIPSPYPPPPSWRPYIDGIGYWNESMGQIPEADDPHDTMKPSNLDDMGMLIGWAQGDVTMYEGYGQPYPFIFYRSLGISTMPTLMTHNNMIALAYSCPTHGFLTHNNWYNYRHIWTRFSYDLGETWGDFYDLQANSELHKYHECIYPVFAPNPDPNGIPQLIYQVDSIPGLYLDDDHEPIINRMVHNSFTFLVGMEEIHESRASHLNVSQNYPNPATDATQVAIELKTPAMVSLELYNLTGRKALVIPQRYLQSGIHKINLDVSKLSPGIYFYTVTADMEKKTLKMIVN